MVVEREQAGFLDDYRDPEQYQRQQAVRELAVEVRPDQEDERQPQERTRVAGAPGMEQECEFAGKKNERAHCRARANSCDAALR